MQKMQNNTNLPIIWFTGLPCSGKTTLALALKNRLELKNLNSVILDGDDIRNKLSNHNFSEEGRSTHVKYVGTFASILSEQNVIPIVSLVSPSSSTREFCRNLSPNFVEIYLSASIKICEDRDVKGMYRRAKAGEIKDFTGISSPYDVPENPEVEIDTGKIGIEESLDLVISYLQKNNLIQI